MVGLIVRREISPRAKHVPRRRWGETPKVKAGSSSTGPKCQATSDAQRGLLSWYQDFFLLLAVFVRYTYIFVKRVECLGERHYVCSL